MRFSFYSIERVARGPNWGGVDDEGFDTDILPFHLGNGITIEDVKALIPSDEFSVYREGIGSYAHDKLEGIKFALVDRFPEYEMDETTGNFTT